MEIISGLLHNHHQTTMNNICIKDWLFNDIHMVPIRCLIIPHTPFGSMHNTKRCMMDWLFNDIHMIPIRYLIITHTPFGSVYNTKR